MGFFLPSLLLVPLLGTATALQSQDNFSPADFPVPKGELVVDFAATTNIAQLIESYCELTGVRILVDPQTHTMAEAMKFSGFGEQLVLAPQDVQSFVESAIAAQGFRLAKIDTDNVTTYSLLSQNSGPSISAMSPWTPVDADDLHLWANHDAMLIQATIAMEGVDARQISTNLRPMFSDPVFQSIMSAGNSNSLIFRGTGSQLAAAAQLLDTISDRAMADRAARELQEQERETQRAMDNSLPVHMETSAGIASTPIITPEATPLAERPHLITTVLDVPTELREVAKVLKELSGSRHDAENSHRFWFTSDDGKDVRWPTPRLTYLRDRKSDNGLGGKLIVQAAEEDVQWIQNAMNLITGVIEEEK